MQWTRRLRCGFISCILGGAPLMRDVRRIAPAVPNYPFFELEGWAFFAAFGLKSRSKGVFFFGTQISFFGNHFFVPLINKYDTLLIVKSSSTLPNRHTKGRELALRKLAQVGPFLEGALCQFKRPGCAKPGWHLTFKQKGRTRTVYVPMEL